VFVALPLSALFVGFEQLDSVFIVKVVHNVSHAM
jgi:hypothetical protein